MEGLFGGREKGKRGEIGPEEVCLEGEMKEEEETC